jgi:hypothetical protein
MKILDKINRTDRINRNEGIGRIKRKDMIK